MFKEYRKVHTHAFGNEEDAVVALHKAIPDCEIMSIRRVAQSGMNPIFHFDIQVTLDQPKTRLPKKEADDD